RMLLRNQHYFLMAYSEAFGRISYFRMDKLSDIRILGEPAVPLRSLRGYENGLDLHRLSSALPYMYADEPIPVVFSARDEVIDQVVDWFGKDITVTPGERAESYTVTVRVSPTAMRYWAMQYSRYVRVLSPASLRADITADLEAALADYRK
ncbi:MAG: WYL domain-containing protein, partial [Clostridia bacterium]|nr:WYL domain-containing protein [Clostridia bacterium]